MYLSTIICNGGQRGWGSWGVLYASPALAVLVLARTFTLWAATPSPSSWLPWLGLEGHSAVPPRCSQQG